MPITVKLLTEVLVLAFWEKHLDAVKWHADSLFQRLWRCWQYFAVVAFLYSCVLQGGVYDACPCMLGVKPSRISSTVMSLSCWGVDETACREGGFYSTVLTWEERGGCTVGEISSSPAWSNLPWKLPLSLCGSLSIEIQQAINWTLYLLV